jgi:drug/metabolite transporter (DMT)-like permease
MSAVEWGLLLLLSVLWGGSFFFNGVAIRELPVFTVVVARVALAALFLGLTLLALGVAPPRGARVWRALFVMGLLNNAIPFSLIVWGQSHIASGVASILNATTPLFGVVVAHFATSNEKMNGRRLVGVLLGLCGVALMMGGGVIGSLGVGLVAELACLAGALSYACAGIYGRRFREMGVTPLAVATGQVAASTALLLPLLLIADKPWTLPMPSAGVWLALVGLAALSTALGYILYFRILATAGATNLLLVTFLIPVSAIALGVAFLGESLEPRHGLGVALIALGLAAIDGRLVRLLRGR